MIEEQGKPPHDADNVTTKNHPRRLYNSDYLDGLAAQSDAYIAVWKNVQSSEVPETAFSMTDAFSVLESLGIGGREVMETINKSSTLQLNDIQRRVVSGAVLHLYDEMPYIERRDLLYQVLFLHETNGLKESAAESVRGRNEAIDLFAKLMFHEKIQRQLDSIRNSIDMNRTRWNHFHSALQKYSALVSHPDIAWRKTLLYVRDFINNPEISLEVKVSFGVSSDPDDLFERLKDGRSLPHASREPLKKEGIIFDNSQTQQKSSVTEIRPYARSSAISATVPDHPGQSLSASRTENIPFARLSEEEQNRQLLIRILDLGYRLQRTILSKGTLSPQNQVEMVKLLVSLMHVYPDLAKEFTKRYLPFRKDQNLAAQLLEEIVAAQPDLLQQLGYLDESSINFVADDEDPLEEFNDYPDS